MKPVLTAILFFLLPLTVLTVMGTALFIGFGALLSRWLPLSLFQASGLAIGATLAVAAVIYIISDIMRFHRAYECDEDYEDEEDDFDSDLPDSDISSPEPDFSKVAGNDYCPCGSGRKFKNCCGHTTVK